ncbi:probable clathrin heavy chain 1 [Schistocerca gregaria]|uniref:probable clathrin heavy chain 1 n=1 Tax=Schistocerca gregaria TaxID=7010 RepID=UPI00211DF950|nr:probable clathrin heavy chain 1 [Schistocerca gregaria]
MTVYQIKEDEVTHMKQVNLPSGHPRDKESFFLALEYSSVTRAHYLLSSSGHLSIYLANMQEIYASYIIQPSEQPVLALKFVPGQEAFVYISSNLTVYSAKINPRHPLLSSASSPSIQDTSSADLPAVHSPPADDGTLINRFRNLILQGNYGNAAILAYKSSEVPSSSSSPPPSNPILRSSVALKILEGVSYPPDQPSPLLLYIQELINITCLSEDESLALIKFVPAAKSNVIGTLISNKKIKPTLAIGNSLRPKSLSLALSVYTAIEAHDLAASVLIDLGKIDKLFVYAQKVSFNPDWLALLSQLVQNKNDLSIQFVKHLSSNPNTHIDLDAALDIFIASRNHTWLTQFATIVLNNDPSTSDLQTKLLQALFSILPKQARYLIESNALSHFQPAAIAPLLEEHQYIDLAIKYHPSPDDKKRIILQHLISVRPETILNAIKDFSDADLPFFESCLNSNLSFFLPIFSSFLEQNWSRLSLPPFFNLLLSTDSKSPNFRPILHRLLHRLFQTQPDPSFSIAYARSCISTSSWQDLLRLCQDGPYDPLPLLQLLLDSQLPDLRSPLVLCLRHNQFDQLAHHLVSTNQLPHLFSSLQYFNSSIIPPLIAALLDARADDSFVSSLINSFPSIDQPSLNTLLSQLEQRQQLPIARDWLLRQSKTLPPNPVTDTHLSIHTALAKIHVITHTQPEHFLNTNPYYDHLELGRFCTESFPDLALISYLSSPTPCEDPLFQLCIDCQYFHQLISYLLRKNDLSLWEKCASYLVKSPSSNTTFFQTLQDSLIQFNTVAPIALILKAFHTFESLITDFVKLLQNLADPAYEFFSTPAFQDVLLLTLIHFHSVNPALHSEDTILNYVKMFDKFDYAAIGKTASDVHLYSIALLAYQKGQLYLSALSLILDHMSDDDPNLSNAQQFVSDHKRPELYSALAKKQLELNILPDALNNLIHSNDPTLYRDAIQCVSSRFEQYTSSHSFPPFPTPSSPFDSSSLDYSTLEYQYSISPTLFPLSKLPFRDPDLPPDLFQFYQILSKYLSCLQTSISDPFLDDSYLLSLCLLHDWASILSFLRSPSNHANVIQVAQFLYSLHFVIASHILFSFKDDHSHLVSTCIDFNDLSRALQFSDSVPSLKKTLDASLSRSNNEFAMSASVSLILQNQLDYVINVYTPAKHFDLLISCIERAISSHQNVSTSIYFELAKLYAHHQPSHFLDFLRLNFPRLNSPRLVEFCSSIQQHSALVLIYQLTLEFDQCALTMIKFLSTFDHDLMLQILPQLKRSTTFYSILEHYLDFHPDHVDEILQFNPSFRLDPLRVIEITKQRDLLPLIRPYLERIQKQKYTAQPALDALYEILISEEDYDAFNACIPHMSTPHMRQFSALLSSHPLVEFKRISANLYAHLGDYDRALDILSSNQLHLDLILVLSTSKRSQLAERFLFQYLSSPDNLSIAVSLLYHCYDILSPDVVLSHALRTNKLSWTWPYWVQFLRDSHEKLSSIAPTPPQS